MTGRPPDQPVTGAVVIGGLPSVTLAAPQTRRQQALSFTRAVVLPGRGATLLQLKARLPALGEVDVLWALPPEEAASILDGSARDFMGNQSFSMGAAILAPYCNRIRGRLLAADRAIETRILGKTMRLPANGGGREPGAEQYAIHGLILDRAVDTYEHKVVDAEDRLTAELAAGDFGWGWPSSTHLSFAIGLSEDCASLSVTARNAGREPLPIGIGWHPYFAFPGGARSSARIHLPAHKRLAVNNYDEVLPTGEIVPVRGTPYDFTPSDGTALNGLYLDDCFVDLQKNGRGETVCEVRDLGAHYGLRVIAESPQVSAIQTYAPPDRAFIVIEPQFNWADPFGSVWKPGTPTGMAVVPPGESVTYSVRLELFDPSAT